MKFKATFCDPLKQDFIELGSIPREKVIETFRNTNWDLYLKKMQGLSDAEIFHSPSLEIENIENQHSLAITAIGDPGDYTFLVFYERPKTVKKFFGLSSKEDPDFISDIDEQDKESVISYLKALVDNDLDGLEQMIP
jgi:hypothetical protein